MAREIVYEITGDTSKLEKALRDATAAVGDAGKATEEQAESAAKAVKKLDKAAEDLTKEDKKLEKAVEDLGDASKKSGDKLKDMGEKAGKADSTLKGLAGAVGVVSPELEAALTAAGDLAGGFEILSSGGLKLLTILGPVAVAVGVLAGAYLILKRNLDAATEAQEKAAKAATDAEDYSLRIAELRRQEAVLIGDLSEDEAQLQRITVEANKQIADTTEAHAEKINELRTEYEDLLDDVNAGASAVRRAEDALQDEIDTRDKAIKAIEVERDLRAGVLLAQTEAKIEAEKAAEAAERAAKAEAARAAAQAKAQAEQAEAAAQLAAEKADLAKAEAAQAAQEKEVLAAIEATRRATEALSAATQALRDKQYEGLEAINREREKELERIGALYEQARQLAGDDNEKQLEIWTEYQGAKWAIEKEWLDQAEEYKAELAEQEAARRQENINNALDAASTFTSAITALAQLELDEKRDKAKQLQDYLKKNQDNLTAQEKDTIKKRIKEQRQAARKVANVQKAMAITQVAIDTALGVMAVWAQWAAFPPVAAALTAAVGAVGVAEAITIKRQKTDFATGGIKRGSTDMEDAMPDRLSAGEAVLTRTATARLGEAGVAELNSGASMNAPAMVYQVWKNKVFEPFVSEMNRVGGALNDIITTAGRTPGHSRRPV